MPVTVCLELLGEAVKRLAVLGSAGFDATMPHEQVMLTLVEKLDEAVNPADAANTVVVGEGRFCGMNTDGSGFVEACEEASVVLAGQAVLILGAGGAAAAIAVAVLNEGVSRLYVADQTADKAEGLCAKLSEVAPEVDILACSLEEVGYVAEEAGVIINATYLGIKKEDPVPAEALIMDKIVYVAGEETALVRWARAAGMRMVEGRQMLLYLRGQAQRVWIDREPNVEVVVSDALA